MKLQPYLLHALSPLHAGTGQSIEAIDLPIARMRATGMPYVPGSSVKGVLREARRPRTSTSSDRDAAGKNGSAAPDEHGRKWAAVFGPKRSVPGQAGDDSSAIDHAGALMVGDARLLCLPVRCFRGTFALVTSPLLLHLTRRDLAEWQKGWPEIPALGTNERRALVGEHSINRHNSCLYLEELDLPASPDDTVQQWETRIVEALPQQERALYRGRLAMVDDETMTYLWETATQVDTRVAIHPDSGVVMDKQLWTEESLPPETLLVGLMGARRSLLKEEPMDADDVLAFALEKREAILQFGGKATVGRGRCRMLSWPSDTASSHDDQRK
jgi:CRISPR-associated protein Cmr4